MQQFELAFQRLAHKIAMEAVVKPNASIKIDTNSAGKFTEVSSGTVSINFKWSGISYYEHHRHYRDSRSFSLEEKLYNTSNDSTKISYVPTEGKGKETADWIRKFIENIMAENKLTPVPRFSLREYSKKKQAQRVFAKPSKQEQK